MTDENNKDPNKKRPGENPEGKYHFNPGNMAGKKPGDASRRKKTVASRMSTRKSQPPARAPGLWHRPVARPQNGVLRGHLGNRWGLERRSFRISTSTAGL